MYEFRRLLKSYFPHLQADIGKIIRDDRRQKSCTYGLSELFMGAIMMYMLRSGSRNEVNELRDSLEFRRNYRKLLGLGIPHDKTVISTNADIENTSTKFVFMSSIPVDNQNVKEIFTAGRLRWKIENEGFNTQNNSGLALHHKMSRTNIHAMKNYYTCLQIAHLMSQLLALSKNSIAHTYGTVKKLWADFWAMLKFLTDYEPVTLKPRYNLRY